MQVATQLVNWSPVYKVTVEDRDTWNVNIALASVIAPVIKAFADSHHGGVAGSFLEEHGVTFLTPLSDAEHDKLAEEWHGVLMGMVHAFELVASGEYEDEHGQEKKEVTVGLAHFAKYFNNLWT
jgi:hypothetical protein